MSKAGAAKLGPARTPQEGRRGRADAHTGRSRPRHILLATDGSVNAREAARAAADLAGRWDATLDIVHACSLPPMAGGATISDAVVESLKSVSEGILAEQVRTLERAGRRVRNTHLVLGHALDGIMEVRRRTRADLVVMGSRGLGGVQRLMLGSVSEGLVHNGPCPVLVMRGGRRAWPPSRVVAVSLLFSITPFQQRLCLAGDLIAGRSFNVDHNMTYQPTA